MTLFGTGIGSDNDDVILRKLQEQNGEDVKLYRAVSSAEYVSITNNSNSFIRKPRTPVT